MVWFNVDDTLAFHQKTIRAGNPAMGLWVRAGSWCAQTLSNGFVPTAIARSLGTPAQARALVAAGLWNQLSTGYEFHEYGERNRTKEDVETVREANRRRKAEQRKKKNVTSGQPEDVTRDSGTVSQSDDPLMSQGLSEPPTRAYQSNPTQSIPISNYVGRESLVGERAGTPPPGRCPTHINHPTEAPCRACGDARRALEDFNRRQAAAAADAKLTRRQVIDDCEWCDRNGIREEPRDVHDYDLPAIRCDHTPMSIEDWRALIPEDVDA
ncbi:hypothetical protein CH289_16070 [Rhodococcus sp. RS1C4]|nr:hypothetical protein [Rhodococcus sp. RS1C4]OZC50541.1 hypothetical protein CH289_16070 [Rhodococcus sp. RS1C4]